MKEKDEKLRMICFNVCANGVSMCLSTNEFELDDMEMHTSISELGEALLNEGNITLYAKDVLSINGKKVEFEVVTDDSGNLHVLAAKYDPISGLYADADYSIIPDPDIFVSGVRIFAESGEYIWNAGAFQKVSSYDEEQFDVIINTL